MKTLLVLAATLNAPAPTGRLAAPCSGLSALPRPLGGAASLSILTVSPLGSELLPALKQTVSLLSAPMDDDSDAQRQYLNRLFGETALGAAAPNPEPVAAQNVDALALKAVKADTERFLTHIATIRPGWRWKDSFARRLTERVEEIAALGGIPRQVPDGWFKTKTVVDALRPELLPLLPEFAETIRTIAKSRWRSELWATPEIQFNREINDLLYGFNTLAQRQPTLEKLLGEIRWLFGSYRR